MMTRNELILAFAQLGKVLSQIGQKSQVFKKDTGLTESEYKDFYAATETAYTHNAWFTQDNVCKAFNGIASWLEKAVLENWLQDYSFSKQAKRVGVIMAGNIPLVGFHDFLSVILSGHIAVCKLSSDDTFLWKTILQYFVVIEPRITQHFEITESKLGKIDAVIATGSDNSSRYFEYYFGKYPHIIRKNRTSVAVITGDETNEDLQYLSEDVFNYFGLGCRNVSQLFLPINYDINRIFESFLPHQDIINHHKYANNFDYNKTISLMNGEDVLENGFVLLKKSDALYSPLAVVNYTFYKDEQELNAFFDAKQDRIQAILGRNFLPFGTSQLPGIDDYADGVNTLDFLETFF